MKSHRHASRTSRTLLRTFGAIVLLAVLVPTLGRAADPDDGKLRILVFGAHPDDCELKAAGVAALWANQGHHVKFVSVTNGDIGHAEMAGGALAQRRTAEVKEAAKVLGIESEVLDIHDGELMPTLENRKEFVRLIREWKVDIVMGHGPMITTPTTGMWGCSCRMPRTW
ncbi:MAG TPA: PIG-L family deacetylase [Sedimentisphaerales bacterium]|nr:PIG-L family deacetylase [Sedimentisphaerales bacterium]